MERLRQKNVTQVVSVGPRTPVIRQQILPRNKCLSNKGKEEFVLCIKVSVSGWDSLPQAGYISSQKGKGMSGGHVGVVSGTWLGGPQMRWWGTWICCFGTDTQRHATTPLNLTSGPETRGSGEGLLSSHLSLTSSYSLISNVKIGTSMPALDKKSELGEHYHRLCSLEANSAFGVQGFN